MDCKQLLSLLSGENAIYHGEETQIAKIKIALLFLRGCTVEQLAEITEIDKALVASSLSRALKKTKNRSASFISKPIKDSRSVYYVLTDEEREDLLKLLDQEFCARHYLNRGEFKGRMHEIIHNDIRIKLLRSGIRMDAYSENVLLRPRNTWDEVLFSGTAGGVDGTIKPDGTYRFHDNHYLFIETDRGTERLSARFGEKLASYGCVLSRVDEPERGNVLLYCQEDSTAAEELSYCSGFPKRAFAGFPRLRKELNDALKEEGVNRLCELTEQFLSEDAYDTILRAIEINPEIATTRELELLLKETENQTYSIDTKIKRQRESEVLRFLRLPVGRELKQAFLSGSQMYVLGSMIKATFYKELLRSLSKDPYITEAFYEMHDLQLGGRTFGPCEKRAGEKKILFPAALKSELSFDIIVEDLNADCSAWARLEEFLLSCDLYDHDNNAFFLVKASLDRGYDFCSRIIEHDLPFFRRIYNLKPDGTMEFKHGMAVGIVFEDEAGLYMVDMHRRIYRYNSEDKDEV